MMKVRKLTPYIILGAALMLWALAAGAAFVLERTYRTTLQATEQQLDRTARNVENSVNRQLVQADAALSRVPMLLVEASRRGEAVLTQAAANRVLQGLNYQTFAFRDLMIIDAEGHVWAAGKTRPAHWTVPFNPAMPDGVAGRQRVIGPVRNTLTGDWTWYLVRTIPVPGKGNMLAAAELPVSIFGSALSYIDDFPGLEIRLERESGQLLASFPHAELHIGQIGQAGSAYPAMDGSVFTFEPREGGKSMLGVVRPSAYPDIRVVLLLDRELALADWGNDLQRVRAVAAVFALVVIVFAIGLVIMARREEKLQAERHQAQTRLEDAIEAMSDGFVMWDEEDRLVTCNTRYKQMYAKSAEFIYPGAHFGEIMRKGAENGQYPQAGEDIDKFIEDITRWHRTCEGSIERLLPDGRWILIQERRTRSGGIVGIRTDISTMRQTLDELAVANSRAREAVGEVQRQNAVLLQRDLDLRKQNVLFDAALNNMSHGLIMADAQGRLIVCNRRFMELFGIDDQGAGVGLPIETLFARIELVGSSYPREMVARIKGWQTERAEAGIQGSLVTEATDGRALSVTQQPMEGGGFVAIYEDVTERQQTERRIWNMAHFDALTRLPNRVLFRSKLDEALVRRPAESGIGILYLDLDKFKDVNDTLGHPVGDALLEAVAMRLRTCLRDSDVVARLSGDEFAILVCAPRIEERVRTLSDRIIAELSAPYDLSGQPVTIGVSIGAAIANDDVADPDTLLKNADLALYQAKDENRGTYRIFTPDMATRLHRRVEIESELRDAVRREQFELAYQPLVQLASNRTIGFEALIRWNHPTRGRLGPMEFIPLAEASGAIHELGAWALHRACTDIARIPGSGKVAVNLSPVQLKSDGIVQNVMSALEASGLPADRLELEITETALLEENERIVQNLHQLRDAGVRIVLDDFGTGYSSLNYLRRFPFQKIKIDKVFIAEANFRSDCSIIVSSIVELATRLGMSTTAEGIETEEQLDLVRKLGCTEGQGYLLGKPASILGAIAHLNVANVVPMSAKPAKVKHK
ncbi:MAG: EAL domain-containing protein [Beijerinckiaceae bacterium]|nr:EAL domain-containing protein [Beijerinckiaceae bacterium]